MNAQLFSTWQVGMAGKLDDLGFRHNGGLEFSIKALDGLVPVSLLAPERVQKGCLLARSMRVRVEQPRVRRKIPLHWDFGTARTEWEVGEATASCISQIRPLLEAHEVLL